MSARLIWVTPEAGAVISYCARVSNPANQLNYETAPKLLKYCLEHKHYSIFEMASMCVEINTVRAISAQILRHRSFSFQEFSQRYSDASAMGIEIMEPRRQDSKNRQNSIDDLLEVDKQFFREAQEELGLMAMTYYDEAIKRGIAKESARFLLPQSTATRLYMTGTIRSWIHYIQTRTDESTQLEHRLIAAQIKKILIDSVPELVGILA